MAKKVSKEIKERMTFNGPSRPNPDVERDLETRSTPHHRVPYSPDPDERSGTIDKLASKGYSDFLDKYGEYNQGNRNIGTTEMEYALKSGAAYMFYMQNIAPREQRNKEALEESAKNIVLKAFKIPEDNLQFDLKLVFDPINTQTPQKMSKQERQEKMAELDRINDEDMTLERAKRRILNAMTQGVSVNGTFLYREAENTLRELGMGNLIEAYGKFASTLLLGYWQVSNPVISGANGDDNDGEGAGAGKTFLDTDTEPPTVRAEAISFPYLIHEACKGVMEYLSLTSEPEDKERYETAMSVEDQISEETWDIRIGEPIWNLFLSLLPESYVTGEDKSHLKYYIYSNLANLSAREFMSFISIMIKDDPESKATAKRILGAMAYDLERTLDGEDIEGEEHFRDEIENISPQKPEIGNNIKNVPGKTEDEDLDDLLSQLGLRRN